MAFLLATVTLVSIQLIQVHHYRMFSGSNMFAYLTLKMKLSVRFLKNYESRAQLTLGIVKLSVVLFFEFKIIIISYII